MAPDSRRSRTCRLGITGSNYRMPHRARSVRAAADSGWPTTWWDETSDAATRGRGCPRHHRRYVRRRRRHPECRAHDRERPRPAHWGDAPGRYSRAFGDSPAPRRPSRSGGFDSTVKVPTEGSGRTSRHPGRRVPVRSLCDGPGVHSAGSARLGGAERAGLSARSAEFVKRWRLAVMGPEEKAEARQRPADAELRDLGFS